MTQENNAPGTDADSVVYKPSVIGKMSSQEQLGLFFETLLPWGEGTGYCDIEYKTPNRKFDPNSPVTFKNKPFNMRGERADTIEEAIALVGKLMADPSAMDLYFCTAKLMQMKTIEPKEGQNWQPFEVPFRKSGSEYHHTLLYIDIDAKDGKYASRGDAIAAIGDFLKSTGFPKFTAIVSSGTGGLHCYWRLETPIDQLEWQDMADALTLALQTNGIVFDQQCTVDAVRILRVPTTHNWKTHTETGKLLPVELLLCRSNPVPNEVMQQALAPYMVDKSVRREAKTDALGIPTGMKAKPRDINRVAAVCPWVEHSLKTGGVDNNHMLRIDTYILSTFCEDGDAVAWNMVKDRASLEAGEFEDTLQMMKERKQKLDLGFPLCRTISNHGASPICQTCPHRTEGKSPLNLDGVLPPLTTDANEISFEHFYAFMPTHSYVYMPTRDLWVGTSVNARLPYVELKDANGQPVLDNNKKPVKISASMWLDQNRPVEQMTWAPGLPEIIEGKIITDGGWRDQPGAHCLNLYRPPYNTEGGDASLAMPWVEHVHTVYPNEAEHIINWMAHRVQHPEDKINHALVLGGSQGIGKDTLLEPLKLAVGHWNFAETSPHEMLDKFNPYVKSVVLRINEARDLGEMNRFQFYDRTKTIITAPPDTLTVNEKHMRQYSVLNVCGVVITTNYKTDGIYLPPDDRRHFVCWSEVNRDDFNPSYWPDFYEWYADGGLRHVAAYLRERDLSSFDPKAPPPKTAAFWEIADANRSSEELELADVITRMGDPEAFTLEQLKAATPGQGVRDSLYAWLDDRKNARVLPHRLEKCDYTPIRCDTTKDGRWKIEGGWKTIYGKLTLSTRDRLSAARDLADKLNEEVRVREEEAKKSKAKSKAPMTASDMDA